MTFFSRIKSKYRIVSDSLGYINRKDLHEKLPDLAKAYDDAYASHLGSSSRRPDIKLVASDTFTFPSEKYSNGSWNIIYAMLDGHVKQLPVDQYFGKQQKLVPGSMILDCLRGNVNLCFLYVHPSDATPLLKEGEELSDEEYIALSVMHGFKAPAREKEYYYIKYKNNYKKQDENPNEYKDTLKSLEKKGLIKINKAGSSQLTLEGKNRSLQANKIVNKYRGY